jgi:acetyl esterase/lipase
MMTEPEAVNEGIFIPARTVPTPHTISAEAQAYLSRAAHIAPPVIDRADKDGWRNYIAAVERQLAIISAERAKPFPAEIIEHRLSAVTLYEIVPATLSPEWEDQAIFNIHGGAFIVGGGRSAAHTVQSLASTARMRTFSVDYRMPPDHPFPVGLDDALEAYEWLLQRYRPETIAVHGSSAGANLAAAVTLKARDKGLPLPGACSLHTAGVDLTHAGDSFRTNVLVDVVLQGPQGETMALYAGDHDPRDPCLSPVFAEFSEGFPPTILISGTRDLLLSPTVMMHRALRRAGLKAELHVFEGMPHGGFGETAPEDRELQGEIARFFHENLGRR